MEFKEAEALARELRTQEVVDAKKGTTRDPTDRETRAAGMIDSLLFQLKSRIEAAEEGEEPRNEE